MNWFYCFVFIQSSILVLHARPEHSDPITFDRKLTLEVGNASPEVNVETVSGEAIPSAHLVANVYVEPPSSSGQSHKRLLKSSPHSFNSKKIDLDNAPAAQNLDSIESAEKQQTLVASSSTTVTASSSSTTPKPSTTKAVVTSTDIPKTRYNSQILSAESNGSKLTKRNRISVGSSNSSSANYFSPSSNNDSVAGKHLTDNRIRNLENRQILYPTFILSPPGATNPPLDLNRQYVYNLNTLISTTTVIPPHWAAPPPPPAPNFVTAFRPPAHTQSLQTAYVLPQQEFYSIQPATVPQPDPGLLNVETIFNSLPAGGATYQQTHQPVQNPSQLPAAYTTNVTRLHSVVTLSSTTPDPYQNYQKLQTRPIVNRRKVLKIQLSTPRPITTTECPDFTISISNKDKPVTINAYNKNHNTPSGNHQGNNKNDGNPNNNNRRKNNNNSNNNHQDNSQKHNNNNSNNNKNNNNNNKNSHNNKNGNNNNNNNNNGNKNNNHGNNKNKNNKNNNKFNNKNNNNNNRPTKNNNQNGQNNQSSQNGNSIENTTPGAVSLNAATNSSINRLCSVSTNQSNASNDNVCEGANNLKIIIKFDADSLNNTREALKPKPTETVDSESEEDDDIDEWEYFYDSSFGLGSLKAQPARRRRRRRRKQKQKPGNHGNHGNKDQETINKYQTIILQTPHPPIVATTLPTVLHKENDHWKHSLFHKFISLLPFLTLLKPLSFGFWTIVLSPILVIAVSGMALAVVLYPWVTISKEHAVQTAIKRPPTVVIHKHERPNRTHRKSPITLRYAKPTYSRRQSNHDTTNRPRRPIYDSYDERRPRRHIGRFLRRKKRRADFFTGKYTFKDINFQHWLMVKNNFKIRHLTWNDDDDDTDYGR